MMKRIKHGIIILFGLINSHFSLAQEQVAQPGYYRMKFGSYEIVALSDGTVPVDITQLLVAKSPPTLPERLKRNGLANPVEISINAYLIIKGPKVILVDAGSGDLFKPHGGRLLASLKTAGYSPEVVTDILVTHIHVDHTGGLSVGGKKLFPNALIHVDRKELDFWNAHEQGKPKETRGISANRPAYLAVKPYLTDKKVKPFDGDGEILPGINAIGTPGHTSGHTLFQLRSEKLKMIFIGDLVHVWQIQFAFPSMTDLFDFNQQMGAQQRRQSYAQLAKEGALIAADHISFPGLGRIVKQADDYKWIPVPYSVSGRFE